jgi:hypothetical protein
MQIRVSVSRIPISELNSPYSAMDGYRETRVGLVGYGNWQGPYVGLS